MFPLSIQRPEEGVSYTLLESPLRTAGIRGNIPKGDPRNSRTWPVEGFYGV